MDKTFFLSYLADETRKTLLDFGFRRKYSVLTEAVIPDGFEAKNLPDSFSLSDDLIHIDIFYSIVDKKLNCTLAMEFKKIKYTTVEYTTLSQHVRLINQHVLTPIILLNTHN